MSRGCKAFLYVTATQNPVRAAITLAGFGHAAVVACGLAGSIHEHGIWIPLSVVGTFIVAFWSIATMADAYYHVLTTPPDMLPAPCKSVTQRRWGHLLMGGFFVLPHDGAYPSFYTWEGVALLVIWFALHLIFEPRPKRTLPGDLRNLGHGDRRAPRFAGGAA